MKGMHTAEKSERDYKTLKGKEAGRKKQWTEKWEGDICLGKGNKKRGR